MQCFLAVTWSFSISVSGGQGRFLDDRNLWYLPMSETLDVQCGDSGLGDCRSRSGFPLDWKGLRIDDGLLELLGDQQPEVDEVEMLTLPPLKPEYGSSKKNNLTFRG